MTIRLTDADQTFLVDLVRSAGAGIMEIYSRDGEIEVDRKADDSPLTLADRVSHDCIVAGLHGRFPDVQVLSEEGREIPWETRRTWESFFLVDPLDGTKEFINRNGEFTVNIALVVDSIPVFGVVGVPARSAIYSGGPGYGSRLETEGEPPRRLRVAVEEKNCWNVVASRSHPSPELARFLARLNDYRQLPFGSSLKFCRVADGSADYYPRFGPTMEWDTAAGQAVLTGAGGEVIDSAGEPLRYNKPSLLNPIFLAGSRSWKGEWA